jgi:PilZ domain
MENRLGHRQETREAVTLRMAGGLVRRVVLTDLSFSGGFVRTSMRVPLRTPVTLGWPRARTQKPDGDTSLVIARVVRHCQKGMGVEWREFAPPSVALCLNRLWLTETMRALSPQPSVLALDQPPPTDW